MGTAKFGFNPSLAVPFFDCEPKRVSLTTEFTSVLPNDPQRVYLLAFYANIAAAGNIFLAFGSTDLVYPQFSLSTTIPFELWWAKCGALVTRELYAKADIPGAVLFLETVRYDA